jgi:hypothetical protein
VFWGVYGIQQKHFAIIAKMLFLRLFAYTQKKAQADELCSNASQICFSKNTVRVLDKKNPYQANLPYQI